jgi:phage shock protein A
MTLITRVTRLFRADMHGMLDALEEPELLLKQAIREMQATLEQEARQTRLITQELQQHATRQQTLEDEIDGLCEELDLCFEQDNETLARSLLRQRLEKERLVQHLKQMQERLRAVAEELRQRMDDQRIRLQGMQQKLTLLATQPRPDRSGLDDVAGGYGVTEEEVERAWLRECRRRVSS